LHARVQGTIVGAALAGMTCTYRGWHQEILATTIIGVDGKRELPATLPIF